MDTNKIKADLHVHTSASIHAYSSLRDITNAAAWRGLSYVAITDHFYGDSPFGVSQKQESSRLKLLNGNAVCHPPKDIMPGDTAIRKEREYYPYECGIISGVELNFGHIYEYPEVISTLGLRLGGFHNWFYDYEGKLSAICKGWEKWDCIRHAIEVCPMDIIVHPERDLDKLFEDNMDDKKKFLELIVDYAKENNKILELNEGSTRRHNPISDELMLFWIKLAKEKDIKISLGSDAHIDSLVGGFRNVINIINTVKYPEELIVNTDLKWLESLAQPYTKDM